MIRQLLSALRKAEAKLTIFPVVAANISIQAVQYFPISTILRFVFQGLCVALAIYSALSKYATFTDTVGFYVVAAVVEVFGLIALFQRKRTVFMLVYLLAHMVVVIAVSFGISRFYTQRNIIQRGCEEDPPKYEDCTEQYDGYNLSIIRNSVIVSVELLFIHPITTYILLRIQNRAAPVKIS